MIVACIIFCIVFIAYNISAIGQLYNIPRLITISRAIAFGITAIACGYSFIY